MRARVCAFNDFVDILKHTALIGFAFTISA